MNIAKLSLGLVAGLALTAWGVPAHAVSISIFNSGVSSSGSLLPDGATDPHYTVNGSSAAVVNTGFPLPPTGPWTANTATSRWISVAADQAVGSAPGTYTYNATFDLTGLDPSTANLTGSFATDNAGAISINGNPVGATTGTGFQFAPFNITSGFVAGLNTLTINVVNLGTIPNATGMQIQVSGTASPASAPVPEPASLGLLGLSLAGLFLRLRHR